MSNYKAIVVGPFQDKVLLMAPKLPQGGSPALPVVQCDGEVEFTSVNIDNGNLILTTGYPMVTRNLGPVDDLYGRRVIKK